MDLLYLYVYVIHMDRKLTVSLDRQVIEKAKKYASIHQTSLSRLIEAYFESLTADPEEKGEVAITPLVESLWGVIRLPQDYDYKEARTDFLKRKHK